MTALLFGAQRRPFGRFNGGLAGIRPDDLAASVIGSLLSRRRLHAQS
jgi:acetyl-CoA acetyltransferase